jgi:ketosteroid isomerase-like protein
MTPNQRVTKGVPMSHPNEDLLRKAYAAFGRGDLDEYLRYCNEDIVFHVPGRSPVAGTYTRAQFREPFIGRLMELCKGTFRERVLDVVANDRRGLVLAEHEFERKGKEHVHRTAHIYRIEGGKLAEFREYPEDLYALDAAWS